MKNLRVNIEGIDFMKASLSKRYAKCVGVARKDNKIMMTNVSTRQGLVEFTPEEWSVFVKGVKNGEFDTQKI
jgi:hypothetical protein